MIKSRKTQTKNIGKNIFKFTFNNHCLKLNIYSISYKIILFNAEYIKPVDFYKKTNTLRF